MNKHAIFVEYLADVKVFAFLQKTKWQANVMKLPVVKFQAPVSWAWKLLQLFSAWGGSGCHSRCNLPFIAFQCKIRKTITLSLGKH